MEQDNDELLRAINRLSVRLDESKAENRRRFDEITAYQREQNGKVNAHEKWQAEKGPEIEANSDRVDVLLSAVGILEKDNAGRVRSWEQFYVMQGDLASMKTTVALQESMRADVREVKSDVSQIKLALAVNDGRRAGVVDQVKAWGGIASLLVAITTLIIFLSKIGPLMAKVNP